MPAPSAPVQTLDNLTGALRELAEATAESYGDQVNAARRRPHDGACGEHRHNHIHTSGFLLGLCSALAMATGGNSDDLYQQLLGGRIR